MQVSDPDVHVPMKVVRYRHRDRDREKSVGDGERIEVSIPPKELGEQKPGGEGRRGEDGIRQMRRRKQQGGDPDGLLRAEESFEPAVEERLRGELLGQ